MTLFALLGRSPLPARLWPSDHLSPPWFFMQTLGYRSETGCPSIVSGLQLISQLASCGVLTPSLPRSLSPPGTSDAVRGQVASSGFAHTAPRLVVVVIGTYLG